MRQGELRLQGLVSLPSSAETKVCGEADPPPDDDGAKIAVTFSASFIATLQVAPLPLQAPPQLVNEPPALGVAVNVTTEAATNSASQSAGQLMPEGLDVTVPAPELAT